MPGLLDYSASAIPGAAIRAAGFDGCIRYVEDPTRGLNPKHCTATEYTDLIAAGCDVYLVYEVGTDDALAGFVGGVDHAWRARAGATWLGYPPDRPIFFACDMHVTPDQVVTGLAYLDGAASVLGVSRVGAYGFGEFIGAAHAGGHAVAFWLCGSPPPAGSPAHIYQRNDTATSVGGVACDINEVIRPLAVPAPDLSPSVSHQEDPMAVIPILIRPDGTFRGTIMAESGGGSSVVAQAWLDLGSTWGSTSIRATALGNAGDVLATWPTTDGLGEVPNNTVVMGIVLPQGTCMVTVEGKVDDLTAGTVPAASVMSKPR